MLIYLLSYKLLPSYRIDTNPFCITKVELLAEKGGEKNQFVNVLGKHDLKNEGVREGVVL